MRFVITMIAVGLISKKISWEMIYCTVWPLIVYHCINIIWNSLHRVSAIEQQPRVLQYLFSLLFFAAMYLLLSHYSKKYESDTIKAELYMWKLDIVSSMGVAAAFAVQTILVQTQWKFLVPYIDPTVAVIMALFLIKEPVKVIFRSIRNLVLFAPEQEVFDQIYAIVNKHMQEYPYEVTFLDVIQTGRKLWVEVYIGNQTDVIHISILHRVRDEIKQELRHKYDQVYIEIIPD